MFSCYLLYYFAKLDIHQVFTIFVHFKIVLQSCLVLKFISETHRSTTIFGFGAKAAAVASARAKMFAKAKMQGSQAIINEHVEIKLTVTYALFIVIYNVTVSGTLIEFTE